MPTPDVAPRIAYRVRMPRPASHHFHVETTVAEPLGDATELALPVWTPGSYMVRDFSRHLFDVRAVDARGRRLVCRKIRKNAWNVVHGGRTFTLSYRAFAFDPTVRTAFLDADRGWFNGANLLPFLVGRTDLPAVLRIDAPPGWNVDGTMPRIGRGRTFAAADYDAVCDHPFVMGKLRVRRFKAAGRMHRFTLNGDGDLPERTVKDTAASIEAAARLFGGLPYREYAFLVNFGVDADGMGGLEHRDCSLLHVPGRATLDPVKYRAFVGLVSHEHFHLWNVKRIRDRKLGPFDYESEVYTDLLWFHEGFTSYYDDLLPTRAGVFSTDDYLGILADSLSAYAATPGRLQQPLTEASFDAWIKFYKRNEESRSTTVSYYAHGALIALLMDLHLRTVTRGKRSLDHVMKALWQDAKSGGVLDAERWLGLARAAAGVDLRRLYDAHVAGTREPDFADHLRTVGLELRPRSEAELTKPFLGLVNRVEGGRLVVEEALHGGPAFKAGLQPRDELVAVDGRRIGTDLDAALRGTSPGRRIDFDVFRADRLRRIALRTVKNPAPPLMLIPRKRTTAAERKRFTNWCGRPFPSGG